jgi:hypothetical protein
MMMTNEMCGLRLPSTYVDINDQEMEYLDGGRWGWKEWTILGCAVVAAGCAIGAVFCPPAAVGTIKALAVIGSLAGLSGTVIGLV